MALLKGWVAATVAGSPCNTYSEARHHYRREGVEMTNWPRPIRSAEAPSGLPGLRARDMKHLQVGSSFALVHAGVPTSPERVSVWRLAAMELLLTHPAVTLHHVLLETDWTTCRGFPSTGRFDEALEDGVRPTK